MPSEAILFEDLPEEVHAAVKFHLTGPGFSAKDGITGRYAEAACAQQGKAVVAEDLPLGGCAAQPPSTARTSAHCVGNVHGEFHTRQ